MRGDNLSVTLRAEGPGFEERFLVEDAALVHILTRFHVVQCVGDTIKTGKEAGVIDVCSSLSEK